MTKKIMKSLAVVMCAVLLVAGSIAGTMAYLTSQTEAITNTFTAGKVAITMTETDVDLYGAKDGDARVNTNSEYKLIPGRKYVKDPIIHVERGSEICYLFVKIENGIKDIEAATDQEKRTKTIADQLATNGWTSLDGVAGVYTKAQTVDARNAAQNINIPVFESFTIKPQTDSATIAKYASAQIVVTAYAIQADGFNDAKSAWTASGFGTNASGLGA